MRKWLAIAVEHLTRREAHAVAAAALPADPPSPVVKVLTTLAHGGGLWVAMAAALATRPGPARCAARDGIIAVAVASASCHVIKRWIPRQRPAADHLPARQALVIKPTSSAFPSAHSATAVAFSTAVACESPGAGLLVAPVAMAVAYSRIRTWAHWPSDVIAGVLWGITVGVITRRLLRLRPTTHRTLTALFSRNRDSDKTVLSTPPPLFVLITMLLARWAGLADAARRK
jgi:membrane-associated phospholipid phosphatase